MRCFGRCGTNLPRKEYARWQRFGTSFPFSCKRHLRLSVVRQSRFFESGRLSPSAHRPTKGSFFLPEGRTTWVKGKVMFGNCYGFHWPAFSSCRYIFLMRSSTFSEESLARIRSVMRGKEKGVGWLHSRHTIVCFWMFSKTCVIRPRSIP